MKWSLITMLLLCGVLSAQGILEYERSFKEYQTHLDRQEAYVDSVQQELDTLLDRIDSEKSLANPDEEQLAELMSSALALSNAVDRSRERIAVLQDSIALLGQNLNRLYTQKIDSLEQTILNTTDPAEKEKMERLQLQYTLRRMQVSPELPKLSFDPMIVENIRPDSMQNEMDRKIYTDFLNRAHQELEEHYNLIKELETDIRDMIRLEEKAVVFMEDIEDGALLPLDRSGTSMVHGDEAGYPDENSYNGISTSGPMKNNRAFESRIRSVIILNHQLSGYTDYNVSLENTESLSNEERLEILEQTKQSLKHYLTTTAEKLGDELSGK
jgi:hypothetical protein